MRIGLDFDRVLFKTDKFDEYLKKEVDGLEHVDASPYNEHGVYSPKIHAELCGIDVEKIYSAMRELERFLYEDVEILEDTGHEVVIVTRGEYEFQKRKIEGAGADQLVEDVFIVEKGPKNVGDIDFLIDDRKKELEKAEVPGFELDRQIHSLKDGLEEAEEHAT
jgi:hypothetical protein